MFFRRREPQYVLHVTHDELRIILAGMIVFRNRIIECDGPTEDIDALIIKIQKVMK